MRSRLLVGLVGWSLTVLCMMAVSVVASAVEPRFGVSRFSFSAVNENGEPFTQAGGHPYELRSLL